MNKLRILLFRIYTFISEYGLTYVVNEIFNKIIFYSPLWESIFVKKVSGKKLINITKAFSKYRNEDLVSVILPVNNGRSNGVERLVASLKSQSHQNIEFIAVDSGSTDDTVLWLRSQEFTVIEIDPISFTHSYSRNVGASYAKGSYLLFVVDDVVFSEPDWIRSALFLLDYYKADSLSSKQSIDDNADLYAKCLDTFLMNSQSNELSVNYSTNSPIVTWLRKYVPFQVQFKSLAIDNTNHIVKKKTFDDLLFETITVEDIDFARRLTKNGGRTIYTNLLSVIHYHKYNRLTLLKYARRVFIDSQVITKWYRRKPKISSRESFLISGFYILGLFLLATERVTQLDEERKWNLNGYKSNFVSESFIDLVIKSSNKLGIRQNIVKNKKLKTFDMAAKIFEEIFGGQVPSDLYFSNSNYRLMKYEFQLILSSVNNLIFYGNQITLYKRDEIINLIIFLWTNFMMINLANKERFKSIDIEYSFSDWDIKNW